MEEPKISPVKINTRNGFTVLVHGNFAIDSGRRGFIGFTTLLNKQEDTVIEGTDSLQIMWNKILAQEIMFPEFPKFLQHCLDEELLISNKSTDEVSEFLNTFSSIQFGAIPFINQYTCTNYCFGKVVKFNKGKSEVYWQCFDSHKKTIELPEVSDFTKVLDVLPSLDKQDCVYISHNDAQYQILPTEYNPDTIIIQNLINSLSEKAIKDINHCKWLRTFLILNEKAFFNNESLVRVIILIIKKNLLKSSLSDLSGNSKNLGELLTYINKLSGSSCKKFFAVNIKEEDAWFNIWNDNQDFVFVPSFLTVEENYISDDYINPICNYLETSNSIPADNHYDILQRILRKKRFEELFQNITENFKSLALFKIQNIKIKNKEEFVTKERLNSLVEHGLLFYFSSDFKENALIKLYAKLIDSIDIYFIAKTSFFKDERILSPNEEQDILKSFQKQDYKNIEYDKKFLADFLEKMFDYTIPISAEAAPFYRFLFSNCNKKLKDETICFNNGDEIWTRIYKSINPNSFFIPDTFQEHTRRQILENKTVLNIIPLNAKYCLDEMKNTYNLSFFNRDDFFLNEKVQETLFKEFNDIDEELYLRIPLQLDCITKQYVAPKDKSCYLNSNGIKLPKGFISDFYLIEPASNEILASKQKTFLKKLDYKNAVEKFIALGTKYNIDIFEEIFSLLSHIDKYEEFSNPSSCGCALTKWIPVRGSSEFCSVRQIIDEGIFPEPTMHFLTTHFALFSKDDISLSEEKFSKMHSRKMFPVTYERLFECFVEPFSEKLYFKIQFDTIESLNSCCSILKDFEDVPVYGAICKLLEICNNENSREQLFTLYKKLEVKCSVDKQIKTMDICLKYLNTLALSVSCERIFAEVLEKRIDLDKKSFNLRDYKYPVQNNTWKDAADIAATDDTDYEPDYLLKKDVFDLLKNRNIIKTEQESLSHKVSELEYTLSSEDSTEKIRETFTPWFECEYLEQSKLIYLLFLLLQGNFSTYALEQKGKEYYGKALKEYQIETADSNKTLWINNIPESEIFTSFKHFKTVVHIPKGNTVPLLNLLGDGISVVQANIENPNTLFRERAWMSHSDAKSNVFHLELKKISNSVHEMDRKLQELIELQVLNCAYRQYFNKNGYKLFAAFLNTNQNTVKSTVLYIFDSLFDKLSSMGLKSNKDFKSLYTQYSELFNRQTSLDNEKFQSYESEKKNEKQSKIIQDKNKLNEKLKNLILTNADVQKDIHTAVKKQIKKNQYSVSRILYELLQNADDSVCDISDSPTFKDRRSFSVKVSDKKFIVTHYGRRINETPVGSNNTDKYQYDLKNMLALNASDKDEGDTGQFGLGFKSIYIASNEPIIRSGELQFKIIAALYPQKVDTEVKLNDFETRIEFELTEDNYSVLDILTEFSKTAAIQPLLCRGINEISIQMNSEGVESRNTYCVKVLKEILNTSFGKIELVNLDGQNYFVIEGKDNLYKIILKERDNQVDIFKSSSKENMPRIWNLAPFAEYENLPFIINASFDLDPGRTSLSKVDNKNKILLDNISDSISQLLCKLYEKDDYNVGLLASLLNVFLITTNSPEQLFAEFAKRILKSVSGEKNIIPTGTNKIISVSDKICAITANNYGLRPDDISFVTVLNLIQKIFGEQRYIVSNTVNEIFGKKWDIIDSYESILNLFSEMHDSVLDNECLETFLEILKNTDHSEDINWSLFNIRNKDGIPKPINSFTFVTTERDTFEIISEEYSDEIIEYFKHQEFAKNNVISERDNTIAIQNNTIAMQTESIQSLTSQVNTLREAIKARDFGNLDILIDNYNFTDEYDDYYGIPYSERCSVIDVYYKWKSLSNDEWKYKKQDYYNRLFPSIIMDEKQRNEDLNISPAYFESYDTTHPTMPKSWCILFMLGNLQSLNYWGEVRSELARKNKIESLMDLITYFSNGNTLDYIYDKYLDTHETDESDLEEFENLLRVYKFRRKFMEIWSQFYGIKYEDSVELNMLINASTASKASGKGLGTYSSQKSLKYGISMIVRELLDSGFFGNTEQEQEKAFALLNKFTYIPHAYLRRIAFNDWTERPAERTSEAIHYAILDALRAEPLSEEEIRAFMKCHDLPFLIFGEKK